MKVALITGCSSGLGKALARSLHTGGWDAKRTTEFRVFATSRNPSQDLQDLKLEGIDILQLDVTDPESIRAAVDEVVRETGGIDVLLCNAGILRIGPMVEQELSDIKAVFDTNVYGTLLCARAVAPTMIKQRSGTIAVTGSITANVTGPYCGTYSASKSAVRSMTEALRLEMSPYSVHVTHIEAGFFRSSLVQKSVFDARTYRAQQSLWRRAVDGMETMAKYIAETPTTTSEEVAVAVAKQLCRKQGPPAHFLVGDQTWVTKLAGFIYTFVSPDAIHKNFTSRFGLDKKW